MSYDKSMTLMSVLFAMVALGALFCSEPKDIPVVGEVPGTVDTVKVGRTDTVAFDDSEIRALLDSLEAKIDSLESRVPKCKNWVISSSSWTCREET